MDSPGSKEQGPARVVAQRDKDFRGGIAPQIRAKQNLSPISRCRPGEGLGGRRQKEMFTGSLIDDLIATVERAERHVEADREIREVTGWPTYPSYEAAVAEQNLYEVA